MKTALMVDHLRRPKKARSVYAVLRYRRDTGAFDGLECFYSTNAKAEHCVMQSTNEKFKYEIIAGHVI